MGFTDAAQCPSWAVQAQLVMVSRDVLVSLELSPGADTVRACPRAQPTSQPPLRHWPAPASGNDFSGRFTVTFTLGTENSASFTNVISIEGSFPISFHLSPN